MGSKLKMPCFSAYCFILVCFFFTFQVSAQYPDSIRMNDIRFIASHNSYKKKPDPGVIKFLSRFKRRLGNEMNPVRMDYGHELLSIQFSEFEVRGLELDLYNDPKGGRFAKRRINLFVPGLRQRTKDTLMRSPGLKMLHIADIDYESNYSTFRQALAEIKEWSVSNPDHTPIFINLELKDASPGDYSRFLRFIGFKKAIPFDSLAYTLVEADIRAIFNEKELFLPKQLQDTFGSVRERLQTIGWPSLNQTLGKIAFILDGNGAAYRKYAQHQLAFCYSEPGLPETAFVIKNNPIGQEATIASLTELYIVRTRTDVETIEARNNDQTMLNAALLSQAQILSTDYYRADPKLSNYKVSLVELKPERRWPFILRNK